MQEEQLLSKTIRWTQCPSTQGLEEGELFRARLESSGPVWFTQKVPGQQELQGKTPPVKNKQKGSRSPSVLQKVWDQHGVHETLTQEKQKGKRLDLMNEKGLMRRHEMKAGFVISFKKDQCCIL